ncbi:MAG: hypothetical protein H0W61_12925 [Bacteroidetes bacterium]|nr:hypothetical protein [Bacteroidota bacterium]
MKPEQEFDKIIQQRIEEAEGDFPFDENNWQNASKLIDAERGVAGYRNNKHFLLLGALFLILGSVSFFGYKYINSGSENEITQNKQQHLNSNISNGEKNEMPETAGANLNEAANNKTNNSASENMNEEGASTEKQANASSSVSDVKNTGSDNLVNAAKRKGSKSSELNSAANSSKIGIISNAGINNVSAKNNSHTSSKNNILIENGDKSSKSEIAVDNTTVQENAGSNMYENLFLKTKITSMPAHNLDGDLRKTTFDFIRIYRDDYFTPRRRKTIYLDAEVGTAYLLGWNAPKGKDAKGFNAYAGLNLGFHVWKKFSGSVGAQVYNMSNIQQPFYTASSVSYDFGSNGTYTTIATNSLFYMAIPVKINYAFNKRNSISLGVNTAMLFGGQNTVETFNMADGLKSNSKIARNNGYYEGTNAINVMITAGYNRAISRRIKLNGEIMYGLSDVYKNTSSNTTRQNNMGIRLGLQYTLFSK